MFMYDYAVLGSCYGACLKHHYTVAILKDGLICKQYFSRKAATSYMYDYMSKHRLAMTKVWDDNHDKTYFCTNGYEFHINRDC